MFKENKQHTVSRTLVVATMAAWLLLPGLGQTPAYGANEKGPRCSDGIDNDGDGLIDCADPDCNCGDDGDGHNGKGGGGGTIPVTVTFRDFPGDDVFAPDDLISDCGTGDCPYIDAVDKVSAGISTRGNLRMVLGNRGGIRTLFMDFSDCIEGPCEPPFLLGSAFGNLVTSGSGINLRRMLVGEVRNDLSILRGFSLSSVGGGDWRIFFNPSNVDCPGSSTISITRIDSNTWEIEAGENDVACLAKQASGGVVEFRGLYHIPFKITVQTK